MCIFVTFLQDTQLYFISLFVLLLLLLLLENILLGLQHKSNLTYLSFLPCLKVTTGVFVHVDYLLLFFSLIMQSACQQELDRVLEEIAKMTSEDNRGPLENLYELKFPNCDKHGLYNLKQVSCWQSACPTSHYFTKENIWVR